MRNVLAIAVATTLTAVAASASGQPSSIPALTFGKQEAGEFALGGAPQFTFHAEAADFFFGTLRVKGSPATLAFLDARGTPLRSFVIDTDRIDQDVRIGFLAQSTADFRVQVKSDANSGSFTLQLARLPHAERMRGLHVHPRDTYPSERIKRLLAELRSGGADSLARFWTEVEKSGPIVEPVPNSTSDQFVTFLWKATFPTDNVVLLWPPTLQGRAEEYAMNRVLDTDIWYKTLRLRKGSRFAYTISPNDRPEHRYFTTQLDPLSRRRYPERLDAVNIEVNSVFELPGAPDEQWFRRTPARRGRVDEKRFASAHLKGDRPLSIYTPPGYDRAAGPYPLLILFDGASYVNPVWMQATDTLDNLVSDGRIRPTVVCFVDTSATRPRDQGGLGDEFGSVIANELVPMLRREYAISTSPRDVVIGGYSSGGKTAALIALRHSDVFGNVLSQSGGFNAGDEAATGYQEPNALARMYASAPKASVRFYLDWGIYERMQNAARPLDDLVNTEGITVANRHFRDVLVAKGYDVTARETATPHGSLHWRATLADGLLTLLAK